MGQTGAGCLEAFIGYKAKPSAQEGPEKHPAPHGAMRQRARCMKTGDDLS